MPLINCRINLILAWSANCGIAYSDVPYQGGTFAISETKLCPSSYFTNSR